MRMSTTSNFTARPSARAAMYPSSQTCGLLGVQPMKRLMQSAGRAVETVASGTVALVSSFTCILRGFFSVTSATGGAGGGFASTFDVRGNFTMRSPPTRKNPRSRLGPVNSATVPCWSITYSVPTPHLPISMLPNAGAGGGGTEEAAAAGAGGGGTTTIATAGAIGVSGSSAVGAALGAPLASTGMNENFPPMLLMNIAVL